MPIMVRVLGARLASGPSGYALESQQSYGILTKDVETCDREIARGTAPTREDAIAAAEAALLEEIREVCEGEGMSRYAENTSVSADKSRSEIERATLQRYGATGFMYGWEGSKAIIAFKMANRQIRFILTMPSQDDDQFRLTPGKGRERSASQAFAAWEQATRQRWRALALAVKAKLEKRLRPG